MLSQTIQTEGKDRLTLEQLRVLYFMYSLQIQACLGLSQVNKNEVKLLTSSNNSVI